MSIFNKGNLISLKFIVAGIQELDDVIPEPKAEEEVHSLRIRLIPADLQGKGQHLHGNYSAGLRCPALLLLSEQQRVQRKRPE